MADCSCKIKYSQKKEEWYVPEDPDCPVHGTDAQPLPTVSTHPIAHEMVKDDLDARLRLGIKRYGQPLRPFNGRSALRDAYDELLDFAVYIRNRIYEEEFVSTGREEDPTANDSSEQD